MSVLSKWSMSAMGRGKKSSSQADLSASMSKMSLLSEDPYAARLSPSSSGSSAPVRQIDPELDLGTLVVVVMKAKNLSNSRAISKQNPYCSVRVGKHSDRTKAITRGGQAPVWDHESRFRLCTEDDNRTLKLCVFDQNGSQTEIIGDSLVSLQPALEKPPQLGYDDWFPIKFNNRYVGEVYLEMTFYPSKKSRRSSTMSGSAHSARSSRSQSPTRSHRASTPAIPSRPCSPVRSSPRSSRVYLQHSESMPTLGEHVLTHERSTLPSPPDEAPYDASLGDLSIHDVPHFRTPNYGTSSHYGNIEASKSANSLNKSSRRHSRPLPKLPPGPNLQSSFTQLPPIPSERPIPSQLPIVPPQHHHSTPSTDRAQADIFKQINDGYEASLFERLKP